MVDCLAAIARASCRSRGLRGARRRSGCSVAAGGERGLPLESLLRKRAARARNARAGGALHERLAKLDPSSNLIAEAKTRSAGLSSGLVFRVGPGEYWVRRRCDSCAQAATCSHSRSPARHHAGEKPV
jgi:hypothetical protein